MSNFFGKLCIYLENLAFILEIHRTIANMQKDDTCTKSFVGSSLMAISFHSFYILILFSFSKNAYRFTFPMFRVMDTFFSATKTFK